MVYRYGQKLKRDGHKVKKYIVGAVVAILGTASIAIPAMAASGQYCGSSTNGCDQSSANTPCAGHGSFGAFGQDNNFAGGASGDRTGYNNSGLCGNPSPNSAAATLGDTPN